MKGNPKVIAALNEALKEELTAINQYFLHAEMCENWKYTRLADFIKKQSIDEMKHAEVLIERILFLDATPERTPWITATDLSRNGAVVIWPTSDTAGTPPPAIKERFPDLIPDATKLFDRPVAGRLPALRCGWAVIRPKADDAGQTRDEGKK